MPFLFIRYSEFGTMDLKLKNWKSALAFVVLAFVNLLTNAGVGGGSNPSRSNSFLSYWSSRIFFFVIYLIFSWVILVALYYC